MFRERAFRKLSLVVRMRWWISLETPIPLSNVNAAARVTLPASHFIDRVLRLNRRSGHFVENPSLNPFLYPQARGDGVFRPALGSELACGWLLGARKKIVGEAKRDGQSQEEVVAEKSMAHMKKSRASLQ